MNRSDWLLVFALGAASCVFGHGIERADDVTLVENLGANRYRYRSTRLVQAAPRGSATPVLAIPPAGGRDIGLIEVTVEYGGWGPEGLRSRESDFYPRLAQIAGEMGGTHFIVLRSTKEVRPILGDWLTSLTVDVLASSD